MIRFSFVCAWIVCTRICKRGLSAYGRRFLFMYVQFKIYNFHTWCFISHRFNHIEFVSIWLFDILFERVCGIRSGPVFYLQFRSFVHTPLTLFKHTNSFWYFQVFFPTFFQLSSNIVLLVVCISFICSRFCHIRAHFVNGWLCASLVYVIFLFVWAAGMRKSQECILIFVYCLFDIVRLECFSYSHIVNKFGFIDFEILFSISHILKNRWLFLLLVRWDTKVVMLFLFKKC